MRHAAGEKVKDLTWIEELFHAGPSASPRCLKPSKRPGLEEERPGDGGEGRQPLGSGGCYRKGTMSTTGMGAASVTMERDDDGADSGIQWWAHL